MKRKIIILHFNMELGGAESSLLGLLDTIDYDRYDVDLFLYAHEGELMSMLNPNVRLLPEMKAYRAADGIPETEFCAGLHPDWDGEGRGEDQIQPFRRPDAERT